MILALVILVLAWSVKYLLCWHSCFCIYWMSVSIIPVLGAYRFRQIFSSSLPVYRVIVYTLIILEIMGEAIRVHLVYTVCLSVYYYLPCIYLVTRRPVCYWGKGEMEWYMIFFKQSYIILLNQDSVCQCIKHAHPFNNYFHLPSSRPLFAIVETKASLCSWSPCLRPVSASHWEPCLEQTPGQFFTSHNVRLVAMMATIS